jgi:hypothetical protein
MGRYCTRGRSSFNNTLVIAIPDSFGLVYSI